MRHALALLLALTACAAEPVLLPDASTPDAGPCGGACGAGTACVEGACVAADSGSPVDAPRGDVVALDVADAGAPDAGTVDAGALDVVSDSGPVDGGAVDAGRDVPVTPDAGCIRATQCGDRCFDLTTDDHCGACGNRCAPSDRCGAVDGGMACVSRCTATAPDWCRDGTSTTGGSRMNFCTDLATDRDNCGGCGRERCDRFHRCQFGMCVRN